jgi:crotonobetainyl-CoA:carnitine CoA-transferase CaiB-like acyl-CoA transferase
VSAADPHDRPLAGVRVLDLTRILAGPYCSLLLADQGADVIKVEHPGRGDDTRGWGPPFLDDAGRTSAYFAALNRGKRSVALDLRDDGDRERLLGLARRADVVLDNFKPGVAASLGLTFAQLADRNPAVVCCSISGYGAGGPYRDRPATEIVIEAMTGLMDVTGPPDGEPARFGVAMVDIATGLTAAARVTSALLTARATGRGTQLECSLYATAIAVLGTMITQFTASGAEPRRLGSHHPSVVPYGAFPASDGHLVCGVINDASWGAFCAALELPPEIAERPELATNAGRVGLRAEVEAAVARRTRTRPRAHWLERLEGRGLLAAPVRSVGEAVRDPATVAMDLLVGIEGHPGVVSPRLDGTPGDPAPQPVPALGEHDDLDGWPAPRESDRGLHLNGGRA